jgi:nucleotidyltransferase/DNA polymerase involved in DNA repair
MKLDLSASPARFHWLPGVGPTLARLMQSAGLTTIGQVSAMPLDWLTELAGSGAARLRDFARNRDDRPVGDHPRGGLVLRPPGDF